MAHFLVPAALGGIAYLIAQSKQPRRELYAKSAKLESKMEKISKMDAEDYYDLRDEATTPFEAGPAVPLLEGERSWGLGVEHEVNFYYEDPAEISGAFIKENFGKEPNRKGIKTRDYSYIMENMINPSGVYPAFRRFNSVLPYHAAKWYALPDLIGQSAFDEFIGGDAKDYTDYDLYAYQKGWLTEETMTMAKAMGDVIVAAVERGQISVEDLIFLIRGTALDWSNMGQYPEFVTRDFMNATVEGITDELIQREGVYWKILDILGEQGIVVARRTIAKYRESLHIPPVSQRKGL